MSTTIFWRCFLSHAETRHCIFKVFFFYFLLILKSFKKYSFTLHLIGNHREMTLQCFGCSFTFKASFWWYDLFKLNHKTTATLDNESCHFIIVHSPEITWKMSRTKRIEENFLLAFAILHYQFRCKIFFCTVQQKIQNQAAWSTIKCIFSITVSLRAMKILF